MAAGDDIRFMQQALALARLGEGRTHPNPPVGCVLVRDGVVIAEGWHHRAGEPHAEVEALRQVDGSATGATAYVTLEPCDHTGRTGPCSMALIAAGVTRVVAGAVDPNPLVGGRGLERLRSAGIAVETDVLGAECRRLLAPFATWVALHRPLVVLKVATTLDGRIATSTGDSRWVTGDAAREESHRMRDRCDAIVVGAGTVRADNPALTCRLPGGRDPLRVVLSASLDLPANAQVLRPGTLILTVAENERATALRATGVEVEVLGDASFESALSHLAKRGITSVLVEGGRGVATGLLAARLVDRLACFIAPKVIGGDGLPWAGALGITRMAEAVGLAAVQVRLLGDDILVEGDCVYRHH